MKKIKIDNFTIFFIIYFILLFLEFIFRLITHNLSFNISLLYILLYNLFLTIIITTISTFGKELINRFILLSLLFIMTIIFGLEITVYKIFGFFFDLSLFGTADQVMEFKSDGLKLVLSNIHYLILIFIPFIILVILNKKINLTRLNKKEIIIRISSIIGVFLMLLLSLNIDSSDVGSAKSLYYDVNNNELNIKKFGVLNAFFIDANRYLFGFQEKIINNNIKIQDDTIISDEETKYEYNNLSIDFSSLVNNESNETIKNIHEYFSKETGTLKNEYTGFFENKNLILFMAESFNEIAVREDLTPTLYKLVNSGFVFENFYTPTISSTIGGEYQELTGLIAASGFVTPWKNGNNSFPLGIANLFKEKGYNTYAYHDHYYTFQGRNNYLKAIGFDNFKGCRNGLEKLINCKIWPESDLQMIDATVSDYINSDKPFFTYYVTVSGHGGYSFGANNMARKNKDLVSNLNYSEGPLSYLAANIELDRALEALIKHLEENKKLDDTVIALVGDHYPYFLSVDEVNELSSYKKDSTIEINRSNFIFWNSKMKTTKITKVGSQIDVLPTIYNAFNIPYDSRVIIGKDILSTEPGLAIFGNSSWVSDYGYYFASSQKFVSKDKDIPENYVLYMKNLVANKIAMSRYIIKNDYYRKIF